MLSVKIMSKLNKASFLEPKINRWIIFACFFLNSCSSESKLPNPAFDVNKGPLHAELFLNGDLITKKTLEPNSPAVISIAAIINDRTRKWEKSYVNFAPNTVIKGGGLLNANFQEDHLIVNFQNDVGDNMQVVTNLTRDEYLRIRSLITKLP